VQLAGVPVPDRDVLELARLLREAGFADTAERLEVTYDRDAKIIALSIAEREEILMGRNGLAVAGGREGAVIALFVLPAFATLLAAIVMNRPNWAVAVWPVISGAVGLMAGIVVAVFLTDGLDESPGWRPEQMRWGGELPPL
jgi:hypothetical protein